MANIKSQIKRDRQNDKRRLRNRIFRGEARTAIRNARVAVESGEPESRASVLAAISALDKAAQKGILHKNNTARRKSRLMKLLASMPPAAVKVEPEPAVAAVVEPEPKKAPVRRKAAASKTEKEKAPAKKKATASSSKTKKEKAPAKKTSATSSSKTKKPATKPAPKAKKASITPSSKAKKK